MKNSTIREESLFIYYTMDVKEKDRLDKFIDLIGKSGVRDLIEIKSYDDLKNGGRPAYNQLDLLITTLYGFAFDNCTLRDLEDACKFDVRYMYLMEQEKPSYKAFSNLINNFIIPNREKIFSLIVKAIIKECDINDDEAYIDGTKIEANANKYKFVWKPTTWHINLCSKIRKLLKIIGLDRNVPEDDIFDSKIIAEKLSEYSEIVKTIEDPKELKSANSKLNNLKEYLQKALEYETKEEICGPNRNSYYKTDHDATAMCLKEDYYSGLGSNMHAAYNSQVMVSEGFILSFLVSNSRNDINDFIQTIDRFYEYYKHYPKRICADAGYGSFDNYNYLKNNNIESYVKHQSWSGNVSGKNPDTYTYNKENDSIICLFNKVGNVVKLDNRHPKNADSVFFKIEGCNDCPFKTYCKRYMKIKDEDFKIFEVNREYSVLKQQSVNNLLSVKGIEMRVNRSIQAEGTIGIIKQDMNYTRSRRITFERVETEYMLTFLGYNIRKLFRFYDGKLKKDFWKAPENIQPEQFKKPSARRLTNKVNKKKNKSVNEQSKKSYKYK